MDYNFEESGRGYWITRINSIHESLVGLREIGENINVTFSSDIYPSDLGPMHIVTLSCLLKFFNELTPNVILHANEDIVSFFKDDLHLLSYFEGGFIYAVPTSDKILNLWNVVSEYSFIYSKQLEEYLKNKYFKGCDISIIKVMLDELYANIADHSKSNGIAYSYLVYDEKSKAIDIAFCDFGIGICASLKNANLCPKGSNNFIEYATKKGVTSRSLDHNAGFGLDNIIDSVVGSNHFLRIVSNNELYYHYNDKRRIDKTFKLHFDFKGTLIYFSLDINKFEKEEIIGQGNLYENLNW